MKSTQSSTVLFLTKIFVAVLLTVFGIGCVAFLIVPAFISTESFKEKIESSLNKTLQSSPAKESIAGAPTSKINPFLEQLKNSDFSYRWQPGDVFVYEFSFRLGFERSNPFVVQGDCQYTIGEERTVDDNKSETKTGTAFAIAPGYLATCWHVVQTAERITFLIDEKRYAARIVEIDRSNDLAILAYEGDLEGAELAGSANLELAESVLAFGFPMSEVLGTGVKVSDGIISGIDKKHGSRAITIDGAINPGNSGGPVVNLKGEVVGIANATLVGQRINPVGFASRVDGLRELMIKNKIPIKNSTTSNNLEPKEIAKRVVPSVGLLEVGSLFDSRCRDIRYMAKYNGNWSSPVVIVNGVRKEGLSGKLTIDRLGEVRANGKAEQLPFVLSSIPELLFQPFDVASKDKWTFFRSYEIEPQQQMYGPGQLLHTLLRDRLLGREQAEKQPSTPVELTCDFEVLSADQDVVRVKKLRHCQVLDSQSQPSLEVQGEGEWEFDLKLGVPISVQENLTVTSNTDGKRSERPLSYKISRIDPAIVAERMQLAREKVARQKQDQEVEATQLNPALIDELIADAIVNDISRRTIALKRLAKVAVVPEKRSDVLKTIREIIAGKDSILHSFGWTAYRHWMDASCAPELRRIITKGVEHRQSALNALVELNLVEDLPVLLQNVSALSPSATNSIIALGPKIELAVLEQLAVEKDTFAKIDFLRMLGSIGTEQSIHRLTELKTGSDRGFQIRIESTLREIQRRLNKADR